VDDCGIVGVLVCQVDGVKLMTTDDVVVDVYGGRVTFQTVSKSDEGLYSCAAINDVGSDDASIQLRVLGTPSTLQF